MSPDNGETQDAAIENFSEKISPHLDLYIKLMEDLARLTDGQLLRQPLNEASNCLSHLSQYFTVSARPKVRNSNLSKAKNHLERACLDLCKLTYLVLAEFVEKIASDRVKYVTCREGGTDFWLKRGEFRRLARDARFYELVHVGVDTSETMKLYQDAIAIGLDLHSRIRPDKEKEFRDRERREVEQRAQKREEIAQRKERRRDLLSFIFGLALYLPTEWAFEHFLGPLVF